LLLSSLRFKMDPRERSGHKNGSFPLIGALLIGALPFMATTNGYYGLTDDASAALAPLHNPLP